MQCPHKDLEVLSSIAEKAHKQTSHKRSSIEAEFLASLNPSQKQLWITYEELLMEEQTMIQDLTVKEFCCKICQTKCNH